MTAKLWKVSGFFKINIASGDKQPDIAEIREQLLEYFDKIESLYCSSTLDLLVLGNWNITQMYISEIKVKK